MVVGPETDYAIDVRDLVKRYPKANFNAVDNVSFSVRRGEIFGLLGPNGAGKTTTIGVLTTNTRPTGGSAHIMGVDVAHDPMAIKQLIAVVPQQSNLDRSLKVREILTFHAAYHGVGKQERNTRADELLNQMGLYDRRNDKPSRYSGGMSQRIMIARALMHSPAVLFLDEPTNNLDPQSRLFLWDRIHELHESGLTILLTTHDMEEADRLCERIAIMDHGKILVNDTPDGLKKIIPGGNSLELRIRVPEMVGAGGDPTRAITSSLLERLRALPSVSKVDEVGATTETVRIPALPARGPSGPWGGPPAESSEEESERGIATFHIYAEDAAGLVGAVAQVAIESGADVRDLHVKRPSLEDVFIYLTGRNLR